MRKELFEELMASVKEMKAIQSGRQRASRVTTMADVSASMPVATLRKQFGLSQAKFAALLGISPATLKNWEQGRRQPEGPAMVLLRVAAAHPEALLSVSGVGKSRTRRRAAA